jgi:hypothetical protein
LDVIFIPSGLARRCHTPGDLKRSILPIFSLIDPSQYQLDIYPHLRGADYFPFWHPSALALWGMRSTQKGNVLTSNSHLILRTFHLRILNGYHTDDLLETQHPGGRRAYQIPS